MNRTRAIGLALACALVGISAGDANLNSANAILERSMAAYQKLQTYSDSGTVTLVYDNNTTYGVWRTHFQRKPNSFFFKFRELKVVHTSYGTTPLNRELIWWLSNGKLETWNPQHKEHQVYIAGQHNQITPLRAELQTHGAITLIPTMFYSKAGLFGVLQEIVKLAEAGTEVVNGRNCHKLTGFAQSSYPSGKTFNTRPVTIWIDTETMMIRKVFQDTPKGRGVGSVVRYTYTVFPEANPPLTPKHFQYKVPVVQ